MSKGAKISMLLFSLCILLIAALMSGAIQSDRWKITQLDIHAEFKRVSSEQIRMAIEKSEERSFFKLNIADIQENINQIPWVQKVSVMKKWPDTLIIQLNEHKAAAVWNQNQLLNEQGEIFSVNDTTDLQTLPEIYGSDSQAEEILSEYFRFNELIAQTGFDISRSQISPRGSWVIELSNGMQINLGTEQKVSRLIRLVETWVKLLKQNQNPPQYIDLRYTNGYVVKWPEIDNSESNEIDSIESENTNG